MQPSFSGSLASLDGEIMLASAARIPATDEGLLRGDGVFEVIRLYDGRPFAMAEHLRRLERSALNLRLPLDLDAIRADAARLLDHAGSGHQLGQPASRFVFVDVAGLHSDHVHLLDPGAGHHRPIIPAENPAFEDQDSVMVVRHQQGLRQHGPIDGRRVQAGASQRFGLHAAVVAAATEPGIGPPAFP